MWNIYCLTSIPSQEVQNWNLHLPFQTLFLCSFLYFGKWQLSFSFSSDPNPLCHLWSYVFSYITCPIHQQSQLVNSTFKILFIQNSTPLPMSIANLLVSSTIVSGWVSAMASSLLSLLVPLPLYIYFPHSRLFFGNINQVILLLSQILQWFSASVMVKVPVKTCEALHSLVCDNGDIARLCSLLYQ